MYVFLFLKFDQSFVDPSLQALRLPATASWSGIAFDRDILVNGTEYIHKCIVVSTLEHD